MLAGPLDWGDPVIVASGSAFYLYSTQPLPWVHVPVEIGRSGGSWGAVEDALPVLPPWAQSGATWSPEVHRFGDRWVLYFAAQIQGTVPAVHCIGDAVADAPTGPFLAAATPFICQRSLGGSIDPRVSMSPSGSPYLVWKSDNNSDSAKYGTPMIWIQRLSSGGLGLLGSPTPIFTPDRAWQDSLVEAPDLVTTRGRTWLFYSAGAGYWAADYAIGVARCAGAPVRSGRVRTPATDRSWPAVPGARVPERSRYSVAGATTGSCTTRRSQPMGPPPARSQSMP